MIEDTIEHQLYDKEYQSAEGGFRNQLATVTDEGKRKWIYPKKPSGRFHKTRIVVSAILLLILILTPFIKVNGHPFILFNRPRRSPRWGLCFEQFIVFPVVSENGAATKT